MSRTLSGLFLVGALLLIGRERGKGRVGKIPGPSPSKSGESQKNQESPKKNKKGQKGRTSPDRLKPPRLAALDICIARQADSHESPEFPIRANHATKVRTQEC